MSRENSAVCADCQRPYEDFPIDVVLPNDQWAMIAPNREHKTGLLCAACIVERASKLPRILVARLKLEFAAERESAASEPVTEPKMIYDELRAVIRRWMAEGDELKAFEVVGALEAVKADYLDMLKRYNNREHGTEGS